MEKKFEEVCRYLGSMKCVDISDSCENTHKRVRDRSGAPDAALEARNEDDPAHYIIAIELDTAEERKRRGSWENISGVPRWKLVSIDFPFLCRLQTDGSSGACRHGDLAAGVRNIPHVRDEIS